MRHEDYAAYVERMAEWGGFLDSAIHEEETQALRDHGRTGHPLGKQLCQAYMTSS